jgi:L-ascorbate metabolism protein UlaG (beta-lactamase superfamily)
MELTFHGHTFFELGTAPGTRVVTDPFVAENPLCEIEVDDLDPDVVAVTHGDAFDHAGEAHEFGVRVLTQSMHARALKEQGYDDVMDLNLGGRYTHGGVDFLMTQAEHSIGTANMDAEVAGYGGVAAGYVIDDGETSLYLAGDTCLFGDMKTVIRDVYEPDVAVVPIGGHHTMEPEHAAVAAEWLDVETVVPCHYDTFELIEQDPHAFAELVDGPAVEVVDPGETVTV